MSREKALLIEISRTVKEIKSSVDKLMSGPLKRDAIIMLIQHSCSPRIKRETIEVVLCGMESIEDKYLKGEEV